MLKSLYEQAEDEALIGITIWGDKSKNNYHSPITDLIQSKSSEKQKARSLHYLYNEAEKLLQAIGWKVLLVWDQNSPFPDL